MKKGKRGLVQSYLVWILIALAFLAIMIVLIFILKEKGFDLVEKIKNIFRFR